MLTKPIAIVPQYISIKPMLSALTLYSDVQQLFLDNPGKNILQSYSNQNSVVLA